MSPGNEKMMDIDEWLAHFKLNADLEGYLLGFGIELIEDLVDLFKDEDLLQKCRDGMSKNDYDHFVEAYKTHMSNGVGDSNSMKSDSWVEVSTTGSSASSLKRKFQTLSLPRPCTRSREASRIEETSRRNNVEQEKRSRRITVMDKKLTRSASMDLLIMLDCTGSMQAYIDAAKTRIRIFVKTIGETYPDIQLRIAFIGYRDIRDRDRLVTLPFQTSLTVFEAEMGAMYAAGGNLLTFTTGALKVASELDWSSAIRVLFHIGDYPCRGMDYHDLHDYDRSDGYLDGVRPEAFVQRLASKKVNYCFGQLTHYTDKMIAAFNKHMGYEYIKSAPMNSVTMMEVMTSSITSLLTTSLSSSASTDSSGTVHPRDCTLVAEIPAPWSSIRTERAVTYPLAKVFSVEYLSSEELDLKTVVEDFPAVTPVYIKCAEHPFGKGRSKLAYYAQVMTGPAHAARTIPSQALRVLKQSMYSSAAYVTKEKFEEFLAPQRAAIYLASIYNKARPTNTAAIEFVATRLLQFLARPGKPYFFEETFISGQWERYNNNTGYCAPFPTALGTDHHAVQAFSHWTHHVSGGRLMITDCQGCFDAARNAFVLTDPAVHSVSLLAYGGTNMGKKGFERFFKTHRCNDVCRAMGLPNMETEA